MTVDTRRSTPEVQRVFHSYTFMLICGVIITLLASSAAWGFNQFCPLSSVWVRALEYIGYICWAATLGTLGPYAWAGNTSAEQVDKKLANILSLVGIFAFVMAKELEPLL
jgi:hypothetical protein